MACLIHRPLTKLIRECLTASSHENRALVFQEAKERPRRSNPSNPLHGIRGVRGGFLEDVSESGGTNGLGFLILTRPTQNHLTGARGEESTNGGPIRLEDRKITLADFESTIWVSLAKLFPQHPKGPLERNCAARFIRIQKNFVVMPSGMATCKS